MLELLQFTLSSPANFLGSIIIITTVGINIAAIVKSFRLFEINKIEIPENEQRDFIQEIKEYFSQKTSSDTK
jgi:hypothetical protein